MHYVCRPDVEVCPDFALVAVYTQNLLAEEAGNEGDLNIVYTTKRSNDDAVEESVSGEVFLFVITCE